MLHNNIESYKAAKVDQEYSVYLGFEPFPQEELDNLKLVYDSLINRFGPHYRNEYGWAASVLEKEKPNFSDIEKHVGLDHLRPFYKLASHNVHANPKGVLFRLGLYPNNDEILLAGPSNAGLPAPAHGTAISLSQITSNLLSLYPNADRLVMISILLKLTDEIGEEFLKAQMSLEEEINNNS